MTVLCIETMRSSRQMHRKSALYEALILFWVFGYLGVMRLNIDALLNSAAPYNPREIDDAAAAGLASSIEEFGDISGLTYNSRTGNMVAGHQRLKALAAKGAQVVYEGDRPVIRVGRDGERFPVRVVDWDEGTEKAANIAANNKHIAGRFTEALQPLLRETVAAVGEEMFSDLRMDELLVSVAETEMPAIEDEEHPGLGQMTFIVTEDERVRIEDVVARTARDGDCSRGAALAMICSQRS